MKRRTWTDEQLIEAVKISKSIAGVFGVLGLKTGGGAYLLIKKKIREMGLDTSHFTGQGWNSGDNYKNPSKRKLEEILVAESTYQTTSNLRVRLIKEGILENKCYVCGINEWQGKPLVVQLDHINGIRDDNRIENLRLLCPNCHSQTSTFSGKNKGMRVWRNR